MAVLSKANLLKRQNISVFLNRVQKQGIFTLQGQGDFEATGRIQIGDYIFDSIFDIMTETQLRAACDNKHSHIRVEVVGSVGHGVWCRLSDIFKDKTFGGKPAGKKDAERQERAIVDTLNFAAENDYKLDSLSFSISKAWKKEGLSKAKQEPYADIVIETKMADNLGVSCKGDEAASLAGGGLLGLKYVVPNLVDNMYEIMQDYMKVDLGLRDGDIVPAGFVPDMFFQIPITEIKNILVGNETIGGPIHYMYVGKMDVNYTVNNDTISLNGRFYDIDSYIEEKKDFYFRIRKRDIDPVTKSTQITYTKMNKEGYPLLFQNPSNGRSNFRMVIDDSYSKLAKLLEFKL